MNQLPSQVSVERRDVTLMDILKPAVDGLEAIRLIKSRQSLVRIVVLTMYGTYRAGVLAAGTDPFLLKAVRRKSCWTRS